MKKLIHISIWTLVILGILIPFMSAAEKGDESITMQEKEWAEIKELTIRNSGFRSRSRVVIRYQDKDKKIVEVIENGKSLPPTEFSRYEAVMHKVLEIPQIDKLLPEIERTYRRAESPRISEETKLREINAMWRKLEAMDSDVAQRYRDLTERRLLGSINRRSQEISESETLSQEEKVAQLKALFKQVNEIRDEERIARVNSQLQESRQRDLRMQESRLRESQQLRDLKLKEMETINVSRRLIEELAKNKDMSAQEKVRELKDLVGQGGELSLLREANLRRNLIDIEVSKVIRKMIEEIIINKQLTEEAKSVQIKSILNEMEDLKSATLQRTLGLEEFKLELYKLLKEKDLYPEGKAEFVLKRNECTIGGKKISREVHKEILELCQTTIGMTFNNDSQIVLQLNKNR